MLADAVLLNETNTGWKVRDNYYNAQLLNRAIWEKFPTKTTAAASCVWENSERKSHQTDGFLSVFLNQFPSRISASSGDRYGRWTKITVQLRGKNLSIYNTYRTHAKTLETAGIETPWMQQWVAMRKLHPEKEVDPRRKHMEDLLECIENDTSEGNLSLIMGDFNEDLNDKEKEGLSIFEDSPHVLNVFINLHGQVPSSRQNERSICHVYASTQVVPFINKLGVCTDNDAFDVSDHIPIFLNIDSSLFSTNLSALLPKESRTFQMYNSASVERYVNDVLKQFRSHNIRQQLVDLQHYIRQKSFDNQAREKLESIDRHLTSMRLQSERRLISSPTRYKHTEIVKDQVRKIRLLQSLRKKHRKDQCCSNTIMRLEAMEILTEINPDNIDELITQEKQELRQIQEDIDVHRAEHLTSYRENTP